MAKIINSLTRKQASIPVQLPTNVNSGYVTLTSPFPAEYWALLNYSGANISVTRGRISQQPTDAIPVNANVYLSSTIEEAQEFTLFWQTTTGGNLGPNNNTIVFMVSNEEIVLQGGSMVTGGVASNVNVQAMPAVTLANGSTVYIKDSAGNPLQNAASSVDANNGSEILGVGLFAWNGTSYDRPQVDGAKNLKVNLNTPIPAGSANIGHVTLDNVPMSQAMTTTPSTAQITVGTVATALYVGAGDLAARKQIAISNTDTTNPIYIGGAGVTTGNGYPIQPGQSISFDQNPANTATIYAIATTNVNVAVMEVA